MKNRHSLARTIGHYVFAAIASSALLLVNVRAQTALPKLDEYGRWTNGISEPWRFDSKEYSEAQADKAREKWEFIGSGNDTDRSQWDGDYQAGDLHGAYLRLSDKHGFVLMSVFTCEANVTGVDYGRASVSSGLVELVSELPVRSHSAGHSHSHSYRVPQTRYVPVKWDSLYFLVPEKQIAQFAEELAGVGRFNAGTNGEASADYFWKLTNYSGRPTTGLPVFPPAFERYVKKPVDAAIVNVGRRKIFKGRNAGSTYFESRLPVTIDAGKMDGVRRGMLLYLLNSGERETIEITYAGPSRSTAVITRNLDENMLETYTDYDETPYRSKVHTPIAMGQRVTSSSYRLP